jgi:hypothetical protein
MTVNNIARVRITDKVRHLDESQFQKYGMMEVWEIKGEQIKCRYGTFHTVRLESFNKTELKIV